MKDGKQNLITKNINKVGKGKMTYEDYVKRRWRFFAIFIVVGTLTVGFVFKLLPDDIFHRKAIGTKYVYLYISSQDSVIPKTRMAYSKEQAFRNYYYYHNLTLGKQTKLLTFGGALQLPINDYVEVLSYSKDSLIVKIRTHVITSIRGGMEYDQDGYVPFFVLNDEKYTKGGK